MFKVFRSGSVASYLFLRSSKKLSLEAPFLTPFSFAFCFQALFFLLSRFCSENNDIDCFILLFFILFVSLSVGKLGNVV